MPQRSMWALYRLSRLKVRAGRDLDLTRAPGSREMTHEHTHLAVNTASVCCAWGVAAGVLAIVWLLSFV